MQAPYWYVTRKQKKRKCVPCFCSINGGPAALSNNGQIKCIRSARLGLGQAPAQGSTSRPWSAAFQPTTFQRNGSAHVRRNGGPAVLASTVARVLERALRPVLRSGSLKYLGRRATGMPFVVVYN